jgi:hypothetical protein
MAFDSKHLVLAMGIIFALIVIYAFSVIFNDLPGNLLIFIIALNFLLLVIVLTYLVPKEKILKDEIGMVAILGLTIIALFAILSGNYQGEGDDGIVHVAIYGIVVILIAEYVKGRWDDKTATEMNDPDGEDRIESIKIQRYWFVALAILPVTVLILGFLLIYFNLEGLMSLFNTLNAPNSGNSVMFVFILIFLLLAMVYLVPKEKILKDELGMMAVLGLAVIALFVLVSGGGQWIEIASFAVGGIAGFLVRTSLVEKDVDTTATLNDKAIDHPDRKVQIEFLKTQRYGIMALTIFSIVALIIGFLLIYYTPQKFLVLTNGTYSVEIFSTSAGLVGKIINVAAAALGGIAGSIGGKYLSRN